MQLSKQALLFGLRRVLAQPRCEPERRSLKYLTAGKGITKVKGKEGIAGPSAIDCNAYKPIEHCLSKAIGCLVLYLN